jgi:hypothetical protein
VVHLEAKRKENRANNALFEQDPVREDRTKCKQISRDMSTENIETNPGIQDAASTHPKVLPDIPDVIR